MSKASYVENTPTPNRRSILTGAGGIAAVGALAPMALAPTAAAASPDFHILSANTRELQRLKEAFHETCLQDATGDPAALLRQNEIVAAQDRLNERIYATPVRSWSDVIERAEIANFCNEEVEEALDLPVRTHDRALAELVVAVLTMAKGGANV
jgi:hypothetical protein